MQLLVNVIELYMFIQTYLYSSFNNRHFHEQLEVDLDLLLMRKPEVTGAGGKKLSTSVVKHEKN